MGSRQYRLPRALWVIGPGLMVMLADTDAGSVITASQSGARWGYRLLVLQVLLVPILYLVMELTVRLGIATGKGHAQLIRERFGTRWAAISVGTLLVSALGALVTEFAGIAGAGELFGVPRVLTVPLAAGMLVALVVSGGYRRVEVVGIALGLFELAFAGAAVIAHPGLHALAAGVTEAQPLGNGSYLALVAANVGAVVMPWMLFYQQSAVVEKGLGERDLRWARIDTAVGAVLTQVIMGAVLVATAASLHGSGASLRSVGEMAGALAPLLGGTTSRVVLAVGMAGAALVASIVVSLGAAWAVAEAAGRPRSLDDGVRSAPLFYGLFTAAVVLGATLVLASGSLVRLAVEAEILNALLLPLVLGMLVVLARRVLPGRYALGRGHRFAVGLTTVAVTLVGILWAGFALGL
ncbi:MAG TPA: divalent metal cation transporter [Gaiellaceae bacterium]|nr:divalent metal cation transporter [Gaiellaceae bacterium]